MCKLKILLLILIVYSVGCSKLKPRPKFHKETIASKDSKVKNEDYTLSYRIKPGDVKLLKLPSRQLSEKNILTCNNKEYKTVRKGDFVYAFLRESYFSKMVNYFCKYRIEADGKIIDEYNIAIKITQKKFPFERLKVNKKRVTLSKKDQKRVAREWKILKKVYGGSLDIPLFTKAFSEPLNSFVTSKYGKRRIFNNKKKTQHLGIDYRAAIGAPIFSANSGRIVLTQELFYTGNTVIIDHGLDIFTVYGHLSKVNVQVGEYVPKFFQIGEAGNTGRTTGPHLHWGVKVNSQWSNGISLVEESERL